MKKKKFSGKRHIWSGRERKAGETLVEVMVSAVIFLLLVALLEGSVAFCTNAQRKSREIRENTAAAIKAYWEAKDSNSLKSGEGAPETLQFQTKDNVNVFSVNVTLDSNIVSTGGSSDTGTDSDTDSDTDSGTDSGKTVTFYTFGNGATSSGETVNTGSN